MLIRRIDGATRSFGAPADWKDSEGVCSVLAIRDVQTEQGNFMVSAWEPDPRELAALKAGSHIELWIRGTTHPVVALDVSAPKTHLIRCIKYPASAEEAPACPSNCSCAQAASPAVTAAAARWEAFRKAVVEEDDVFLDLMMDALANEHKLTGEQWDAAIDVAIALHTKSQEALPGRVFANDGSQPEDDAHLHCPACAGSGHIADMTAAARDVLVERRRQRLVEGWTALHDDQHSAGELALAAAFYAANAFASSNSSVVLYGWPWHPTWYKKTTPRRDLEKAGALIQAEIERLDRAAHLDPAEEEKKGGA